MRTKISPPMRSSGRMRARLGARPSLGARSSAQTNAAPMPAWATRVDQAEPTKPQSSP